MDKEEGTAADWEEEEGREGRLDGEGFGMTTREGKETEGQGGEGDGGRER